MPHALPKKPPKLFPARPRGRPKPGVAEAQLIEFIREVYGDYIKAGLREQIRPYLFNSDRRLYDAIYSFEYGGGILPDDIALPSRTDLVLQRFDKAKKEGLKALSKNERRSVLGKLLREERRETPQRRPVRRRQPQPN